MKKSKLLVLSLLAVSAMSLTSCGETGPQGEKGDPGEKGQKGDTGNPGKDGENGEDGKSFLNGEGAPSDTLGNDGDSYVDTKTFDYYAKENGKWVLKGNIKGEKGDQGDQGEKGDTGAKGDAGAKGEKGDTGSTGSRGDKGDPGATAWSNTILLSSGATVTPNKGSYVSGDENVVFTVEVTVADPENEVIVLEVDGVKKGLTLVSGTTNKFTFTTTMKNNGFVVQAKFVSPEEAIESETIDRINLVKEATLDRSVTLASAKHIELNGHNLNVGANSITVNSDLTVSNADTSAVKEITGTGQVINVISADSSDSSSNFVNNGEISVLSDGLERFDAANNTSASLTIGNKVKISTSSTDNAAIKQEGKGSSIVLNEGSKVETTGSNINAKAIEVSGGTVTVNSKAEVSSNKGTTIDLKSGSVNVYGAISSTEGKAIVVNQEEGKEASVKVSDTDATVSGYKTAIEVSCGTVTLGKGAVTTTVGTTLATTVKVSGGSVIVEGATVTATAGTAVELNGGSLKVTSGEVNGGNKGVEVQNGTINVEGGEVKANSKTGAAIYVNAKKEDAKVQVNVTGGTIENTSKDGTTGASDGEAIKVYNDSGSVDINVGVKEEIIKGLVKSEDEFLKALKDASITTIIFGQDITLSDDNNEISVDKDLTISLGEHTLIAKSLKLSGTKTLSFIGNGTDKSLIKLTDGMEINNSLLKLNDLKLSSTKGISVNECFKAMGTKIEIEGSEGLSITDAAKAGANITLKENSSLIVKGKDSYGVMLANSKISVAKDRPGLVVNDSTIEAEAQGVIVRTGTASFNGAKIDLKLSNISAESKAVNTDWGTGKDVPFGAIIVGDNKEGQYNNDLATVTIDKLNIAYPTNNTLDHGLIVLSGDADNIDNNGNTKLITLVCTKQSTYGLSFNGTKWTKNNVNNEEMNSVIMQGNCKIKLSNNEYIKSPNE